MIACAGGGGSGRGGEEGGVEPRRGNRDKDEHVKRERGKKI